MFSSTVSQGNTPRSWKTKMRRGSGPVTRSPSIVTSPAWAAETADDVEQRRLAAARRAEDADELALADVEVDVVRDRDLVAVRPKRLRKTLDPDLRASAPCPLWERAGARGPRAPSLTGRGEP